MTNQNPLYQERLKRFDDALARKTPDIVPVFPIIEQWAMQTVGISIRDSYINDNMLQYETFKQIYEQVYVDVSYGAGNLKALKMLSNFGEGIYQVTDDGVQIKGSHGLIMNEDEYPSLIADPMTFILETILPRKYPVLNGKREDIIKLWTKSLFDFSEWSQNEAKATAAIEENLNVPIVAKGGGVLAPDLILDYLRDFVGTSTDIRRRPKEFADACEALYPLTLSLVTANPDPSGIIFIPLHLATYLRPKDFEKLYFPSMKNIAQALIDSGRRPTFYCENDWMKYLDFLQDLPEGDILCIFEGGDFKEIKNKISNKVCIAGGMPVNMLAYNTVDECVDRAKWCLDNLAPGGGYIFGLDKNLLNKNDARIENLAAVCSYIHENGKY